MKKPRAVAMLLSRAVLGCLAAAVALAGLLSFASPHVDFVDLLAHVAGDLKEGAAIGLKRRPAPLPGGSAGDAPLAWSAPLEGDYAGFGDADLRDADARCAALEPRGTWRLPMVNDYAAARDAGLAADFREDWLAFAVREKGLVLGGAARLSGGRGNAVPGPRRLKVRCVADGS